MAPTRPPLAKMLGDADALVAGRRRVRRDIRRRPPPRLPAESDAAVPRARIATRRLNHDWWVYSFSQLAKADAGVETSSASTVPASGGNDEPDAARGRWSSMSHSIRASPATATAWPCTPRWSTPTSPPGAIGATGDARRREGDDHRGRLGREGYAATSSTTASR
jgi:hypothetical protein